MSRKLANVTTAAQEEATVYRVIYHRIDEPAGTLRSAWFNTMVDAQAFADGITDQAQVYGVNTEWVPRDPQELVSWLNGVSEVSPLTY